jgi:hypothetical protein
MTATASVNAPPSATSWRAVSGGSTDLSTDPQLPIGVFVPTGGSIIVIRNGVSMTIATTGITYVVPTSLGVVTGACFVLYQ